MLATSEKDSLVEWTIFDKEFSLNARQNLVQQAITSPVGDRSVGALVGMALGDAIGAPLEFLPASDRPDPRHHYSLETNSYQGEYNRFSLRRGQWTDDASMGLCLADSLLACGEFDGSDMRLRFWNWWHRGYNNAFRLDSKRRDRHSIGLGGNISKSLSAIQIGTRPPPVYDSIDAEDAGNGSIMRLAPIPVAYHRNIDQALKCATLSSLTTHPGRLASACCRLLAFTIAESINRSSEDDIRDFLDQTLERFLKFSPEEPIELQRLISGRESPDSTEFCWNWRDETLGIAQTIQNRGQLYHGYPVSAGYFGSFCLDGMAMALHSLYRTGDPNQAIEKCVNMLGDADSTASVVGQVAGAFYGYRRFSPALRDQLHRWDGYEIALRGVLLEEFSAR
jgi:ADP-ribosyl-[dinitrogen reductase] hydrolase